MKSRPVSLIQGENISECIGVSVLYNYRDIPVDWTVAIPDNEAVLKIYGIGALGETLLGTCTLKFPGTGDPVVGHIKDNCTATYMYATPSTSLALRWELSEATGNDFADCNFGVIHSVKAITNVQKVENVLTY